MAPFTSAHPNTCLGSTAMGKLRFAEAPSWCPGSWTRLGGSPRAAACPRPEQHLICPLATRRVGQKTVGVGRAKLGVPCSQDAAPPAPPCTDQRRQLVLCSKETRLSQVLRAAEAPVDLP